MLISAKARKSERAVGNRTMMLLATAALATGLGGCANFTGAEDIGVDDEVEVPGDDGGPVVANPSENPIINEGLTCAYAPGPYGVDETQLPEGFYEWFVNVNDGTNEGIRHTRRPWMSVQFHPEAYPGPVETAVLFDEMVDILHDS